MSTDRVNVLNIGLMLASCVAAFALPFELFLFSYAVLGPLHYLTEISWLHGRQYFARGRWDFLLLIGLCALLLTIQYLRTDLAMALWAPRINCMALGVACAIAFWSRWGPRAVVIALAALLAYATDGMQRPHDLLRILLPTVIHVWVFTGAFILYGALRGRSRSGIASLGVFVACSVSFFVLRSTPSGREITPYVTNAYGAIEGVNHTLIQWLGMPQLTYTRDFFYSVTGETVARFVAFAYTYHYLNWFSKTSVIQWHKIPKGWAVANVVIWIGSVALYAWDYAAGLTALFWLSFLHVYLELPLNHRTFAGIATELGALAGGRRTA